MSAIVYWAWFLTIGEFWISACFVLLKIWKWSPSICGREVFLSLARDIFYFKPQPRKSKKLCWEWCCDILCQHEHETKHENEHLIAPLGCIHQCGVTANSRQQRRLLPAILVHSFSTADSWIPSQKAAALMLRWLPRISSRRVAGFSTTGQRWVHSSCCREKTLALNPYNMWSIASVVGRDMGFGESLTWEAQMVSFLILLVNRLVMFFWYWSWISTVGHPRQTQVFSWEQDVLQVLEVAWSFCGQNLIIFFPETVYC